MLNVSSATAHRAMVLLADQNLLVRRRRRGTFVGSAMGSHRPSSIRTVHVVLQESEAVQVHHGERLLNGIRRGTGGANVQFSYLPSAQRGQYLKELLEVPRMRGQLVGVVPMSCGREVYRFLAETAIPTVVVGSLYSDTNRLASVDIDNKKAGRLLTHHLIEQGHRQIAVFSDTHNCPGDAYFYDGVVKALTTAGLQPNALMMRFVPHLENLAPQLRELLAGQLAPTGVIARTPMLANAAAEVASELRAKGMEELGIVFQDYMASPSTCRSRFWYVRPQSTYNEIAEQVGTILRNWGDGATPVQKVLPVELCGPD